MKRIVCEGFIATVLPLQSIYTLRKNLILDKSKIGYQILHTNNM